MLSPALLARLFPWNYIGLIVNLLFLIGAILFTISWITPVILMILGYPWLTHAWFVGIKPLGYSITPWEELPKKKKIGVYVNTIFSFVLVVAIIVGIITSRQ